MSLTNKRFPGENQQHSGGKRHDDVENNIEGDAVLPGNPGIQHKPDAQPRYQAIPDPFLVLFEEDVGNECLVSFLIFLVSDHVFYNPIPKTTSYDLR